MHKSLCFSFHPIHLSPSLRHANVSSGETFCWAFLSPPRSLLPLINYAQMSFTGSLSMAINNCVPLAGAVKLICGRWKATERLSPKSWFITHCTFSSYCPGASTVADHIYHRPRSVEITMSSQQEMTLLITHAALKCDKNNSHRDSLWIIHQSSWKSSISNLFMNLWTPIYIPQM